MTKRILLFNRVGPVTAQSQESFASQPADGPTDCDDHVPDPDCPMSHKLGAVENYGDELECTPQRANSSDDNCNGKVDMGCDANSGHLCDDTVGHDDDLGYGLGSPVVNDDIDYGDIEGSFKYSAVENQNCDDKPVVRYCGIGSVESDGIGSCEGIGSLENDGIGSRHCGIGSCEGIGSIECDGIGSCEGIGSLENDGIGSRHCGIGSCWNSGIGSVESDGIGSCEGIGSLENDGIGSRHCGIGSLDHEDIGSRFNCGIGSINVDEAPAPRRTPLTVSDLGYRMVVPSTTRRITTNFAATA